MLPDPFDLDRQRDKGVDRLDQSLAKIISAGIGLPVHVSAGSQDANGGVNSSPDSSDQPIDRSQSQHALPHDAQSVRCCLALPGGGTAIWNCCSSDVDRLKRHARTILELETSKNENRQLVAEVESLTNQVVQDFEELSLIRTLASNLQMPQTFDDTEHFVLNSMESLASGVGAVSIAAILCDTENDEKRIPIWTGDALIDDATAFSIVERFAQQCQSQPFVYNRSFGSGERIADGLEELILCECCSEGNLHGWVLACNRREDDVDDVPWAQLGFSTVQASLMETATNQLASQLNNICLLRQKEELFTDVICALVNAVEARDPYTCGHSERVAIFAKFLAAKIGFSYAECERIYLTGLLHDVGKIAIPDGVLQKPDKLNQEERAIIETHTDSGWRILQGLDALQDVLPGVLYHHEQWNGKGYPDRLAGENIPIDGRILAVCDAFDAMTSDRPYRKGMPVARAIEIITGGAGSHWDPRIVEVFTRHIDEIDQIRRSYQPRQETPRPEPIEGKPIIGATGFSIPTPDNATH